MIFERTGNYIEYMSDNPHKEYAFLQSKCLDPMEDKYLPAKQSAAFKKSMAAARSEQATIDEVLEVRRRLCICVLFCVAESLDTGKGCSFFKLSFHL